MHPYNSSDSEESTGSESDAGVDESTNRNMG